MFDLLNLTLTAMEAIGEVLSSDPVYSAKFVFFLLLIEDKLG